MIKRTIGEIAKVCAGRLYNCSDDKIVSKFVINDKISENNCVYIALNGENHKGIDFAAGAYENGAALIISESIPCENIPVLLVENTRKALLDIAEYYRKKERQTVVTVSGSVGKTTIKELCYAVLSEKEAVLKTEGNKNNTLGLPLTLLSDSPAKCAVIEAGISEPGEMSLLSKAAAPDIAVITGIGRMHAETLGSREEIAKEKLKILEGASSDCTLIIPAGEPLLEGKYKNTVTVAIRGENADFSAENIKFTEKGSYFDIKKRGADYITEAFVPIIGDHGVIDALFAVAVGDMLGIERESVKAGLSRYKAPENRQNIIISDGVTYICDSYNFGPESAGAAFNALSILAQRINADRTVMMLGSMLELGAESESLHIELGKRIADMGFDILITLGELAKNIALGAMMRGMENVFDYADSERNLAAVKLSECVSNGSAVLIKGSRKMKMEDFIPYAVKG